MGLGIRLRGLWQIRGWVAACIVFALAVAGWTVTRTSGSLEMATATTQVVVDTPKSTLVDIRQDTYGIDGLTNRALLLGNVMASPQVRADIARRAHIPFEDLQVTPPLTAKQPRVLAEAGNERHTTDILKLSGKYRLYIRSNPTVPFLQVYTETPTPASAAALANAAVGGMQSYLDELAASTKTPVEAQIRLMQLGGASGAVVNSGIEWRFVLLAFLVAFGVSCATVIWVRRVREGWRLAALSEQAPA
jgi:uncharacterized protein involved in exopolysaccharide biosynthesis